MDSLLELFRSIDSMHFYRIAIASLLLGIWCVIKRSKANDDVNESMRTDYTVDNITHTYPELQFKQSRSRIYSFLSIVCIVVMCFGLLAGLFNEIIEFDPVASAQFDDIVNSFKWDGDPIRKTFVTQGRTKDAVLLEIKYDLRIEFPSGEKLDILKNKYETPSYFLDRYIQPYLMSITAHTSMQKTAIESYTEGHGEFVELIKKQVLHGLIYNKDYRYSVGTFKSHGLKVIVLGLHFKYERQFVKLVDNLNKAQLEVILAKAKAEAMRLQAEAELARAKAKVDSSDDMKKWIKSRQKK